MSSREKDMPKNFNTNTDNKDEWLTPPAILNALGPFDLDPCAPINRPWDMANDHYTVIDNGLQKPWFGRVWCNPPYGRETFKWMEKLASHGRGVALIFARTETRGFHSQIWEKAHSVFFFKGRLSFYRVDGTKGNTANAPSCLVTYCDEDTAIIRKSHLEGRLVLLK